MTRVKYLGIAALCLLFLPAAQAAAQPPAEEQPVNVMAEVISQSNQVDVAVYTVPPGKQLIVEYVSMRARVQAGEQVLTFAMNLPSVHFFTTTSQGSTFYDSYFTSAQTTRIVVDANQTLVFRVERDSHETNALAQVALAGRLISKK